MCKAFSGICVRSGKVYWKLGMDSHNDIADKFNLKDDKNYCPFEINPKNDNYLNPDEWVFKFDDGTPDWWKQSHENRCWSAFREWKKQAYAKINLPEARNPIHPFKIKPPKQITKKHINLLKQWVSVGASVWDSVRASVGASVGASVRASVWVSVGASVRASVWASVGDSVEAYLGSLFKLSRGQWKYTSKIKTKNYPFEPAVKLWKMGLVPSFDGETWRLHAGKKAKVVFEISEKKLKKC